ncbi:E3 ubiquitin-protein ligase lubel [Ictalurus punctatus]|uniref:E3 ubiquitin-protein ligase lubel n=1 Tax=Ictalurus punctatus TaxID=7998 RepID=A0A979EN77_ICTPU|nr:E3 ubiquitin-protein ligase lubel [Ictalurus punctatus]
MSHSTTKPKCPGCHQDVVTDSERQCVVCKLCSKAKRRVFSFCWDCQREWPRSTSSNSSCTQPNCALRAALISDKRISDPNSSAKGCPYFRACPACNALLTHNGQGCPNITCPKCSIGFCFRCLRPGCFLTDLDLIPFIRERHRLIGLPQLQPCTIVDNSQSLMALR